MSNILQRLQNPDNVIRGAAEEQYNQAVAKPGLCLEALSSLAATPGVDTIVRSTAAVLMRRSCSELWTHADNDVKHHVKTRLLMGIRAQAPRDVRRKLCDTISVLAGPLIEKSPSQWPELFPTLFELTKSPTSYERESALYIFAQLAEFLEQNVFAPHLPTLKVALHSGLRDAELPVSLAALRATTALIGVLEESLCNEFVDLIPLMLQPVQRAVTSGNEEDAKNAIEMLIEVVESEPCFYKKDLPDVCGVMLEVCKKTNSSSEGGPRQVSLEFLVSIAEKLPTQCRKMGTFVSNVFPVALQMMLEIEDDRDWYEQEDEDDTNEYTHFDCGQESLDRLAIALGGKAVLPVAESLIAAFLQNTNWVYRHAALLAISQIGEGCRKQIEQKLGTVIHLALERFLDPHPRVRWAAINCIGQMCTDFGPRIQQEYHKEIVTALITVMDDKNNPRVQSHSAAAVINFCDEASPEVIAPYLDQLLGKLQTLLNANHRITQEQAVTAIAAVADAAEEHFVHYYDWFMPRLKQVLSTTTGHKDLRRLRGKVMECISLVGLSVGFEKFSPDADAVMKMLVNTAAAHADDPDDPQSFYLMQAYARICRCLKASFIPYLPHVMPRLLEAASQKPDITVLDVLEDDDGQDEEGYETLTIGDKRVGIRTSALEDKAVACTMLTCFIAELRGGFYDYVAHVTELMVPLLKFFYHEDCRSAAANCIPDLIRSVMESGKDPSGAQVMSIINFALPQLLDAIRGEPDVDVLVHMLDSLGQIGGIVGPPAISRETMIPVAKAISIVLLESEARNMERRRIAEQEEWDEEANEEAAAEEAKEEELLSRVVTATNAFLRVHGNHGFVEAFTNTHELSEGSEAVSTMSIFWLRLQDNRPAYERQAALCVFDDLILHGGREGLAVIKNVLPAMCVYVIDQDPDVRQAACYGVGVCAQVGGEYFAASATPALLSHLEGVIRHPNAQSSTDLHATDNAVAALMKIMEFQPNYVGDKSFSYGALVVDYLPAKADESEARVMHSALIRFVQTGDSRFLGENFVNLPRILAVILSILGTNTIDEEGTRMAIDVINGIRSKYPQMLHAATANLSEEQRQKLMTVVNSA
ncbi:Importin beta [Gracilaria domingensis]|nr:Importin beta [Gracilaria domingensis]